MLNLNKKIAYEKLISCIPEDKLFLFKNLFHKAQQILEEVEKVDGITLPHLINFLVREKEFSDENRDLLIILQNILRTLKTKDSTLYIEKKQSNLNEDFLG